MKTEINFQDVLKRAVSEPGKIMSAYSAFHGYSFGNQMLAMYQCLERGIDVGPLATFKAWQEKGRNVSKGQKAIALYMPISFKKKTDEIDAETGEETEKLITAFKLKNNWFVLAQTEGEDFAPIASPDWNQAKALETLGVSLVNFNHADGNVQGYAREKTVAVNPLAQLPLKTLFHELGHVILGHTDVEKHGERPSKDLREVEAESVALLCLAALDLPGQEFCRGYIQSWLSDSEIPEKSCKKIMSAADQILKAGTLVQAKGA